MKRRQLIDENRATPSSFRRLWEVNFNSTRLIEGADRVLQHREVFLGVYLIT